MESSNINNEVTVVGTGFGGMAAAMRLTARGYKVRVLEAGSQPGGRARVFEENGFKFDAGPTVITVPHLLTELFEMLGKKAEDYFELVPIHPFFRVEFPDGTHFDYVGELKEILEQIRKFDPRDVEGYNKLVEHSKEIFEIGYEQLAHVSFAKPWDMIRVIPDLLRLKSYKSVYSLVASYIKNDKLRQVFTFQPLLIGGNPFRVPGIYLLIHWIERKWGVHYAMGGTHAIIRAMEKALMECGVEFHYNTPVKTLHMKAGKISALESEDGKLWPCDKVVCNADPSTFYTKCVPAAYRPSSSDKSIARKQQSMSLFVAYFGTKKTYPNLAHHTIILGPRYEELLEDIFERKILADDFSLYLHTPSRTDPSVAPEGHEAFYVLSPVPNQLSGIDWSEVGPSYLNKILDFLEKSHLPGLKENLVTANFVDPRYFEGDLRSYHGAAFGPEPRLHQSAYFRYHNKCKNIPGLHFVGAGCHPGAGVPGVINSAKVIEPDFPPVKSSAA